jgi:hypothetical protein
MGVVSPRRQGVLCIAVGVAAILVEVLLRLLDTHYDSFQAYRAPALVAVGILLIVVGVLRIRGKITK